MGQTKLSGMHDKAQKCPPKAEIQTLTTLLAPQMIYGTRCAAKAAGHITLSGREVYSSRGGRLVVPDALKKADSITDSVSRSQL